MEESKIVIEFTITEAKILRKAIASCIPQRDEEMVTMMLYARITRKIEEKTGKVEPL